MKNIIILLGFSILSFGSVYSQNVNWRRLNNETPNHLHLNFGYDYGVTAQLGYSRSISFVKPLLLTVDYSFPMGDVLFDDFKIRYGGQTEIEEWGDFAASFKLYGNFKREKTELLRIYDFAVEPSVLFGYYKQSWHVAFELGVLKPLTSNLLHSETVKEIYPAVQDGWYKAPNGYFKYGFQGSKGVGETMDISLNIGFTNALGNGKDAILPYYTHLGILKRF